MAIGKLGLKKGQSYWIEIRSIGSERCSAEEPGLATVDGAHGRLEATRIAAVAGWDQRIDIVDDLSGVAVNLGGRLVGEEKQHLVPLDGAAHRAAPLVLAEVSGDIRVAQLKVRLLAEVAVGIERLIAEEVKAIAVEMVGAVLGSNVDAATAGAAVFRRVVAGLHLELFQRIGRGSRECCCPRH